MFTITNPNGSRRARGELWLPWIGKSGIVPFFEEMKLGMGSDDYGEVQTGVEEKL